MRELEALRGRRMPQELDLGRERGRHSEEAARSARAIAEAAERIGRHPPGDLPPEEQESFRRLADALREQAASIAAGAGQLDRSELTRRFAELDATCVACHERFERGPGSLGRPGP
jgi:hypothetical protein